jgi:pyruvate/2-oxoglutarate/acetoin dehydrogenase E1 component
MSEITYSEATNEAIREEVRRDSSIILLGQDIGEYGGKFGVYKGIFEEFGEDRVRDGRKASRHMRIEKSGNSMKPVRASQRVRKFKLR